MAHCDQVQGVAVAVRLGDDLGRNDAVGADFVFTHHRLSPGLREVLADRAGQQVGGAAGRERNDHADRLVRVLRPGSKRRQRHGAGRNETQHSATHIDSFHCATSS